MKKGYFYLVLAALCYASMGALVRVLSTDLPALTQLFLRLLFSGFLTLLLLLITKNKFKLKRKVDYLLIIPMGIVGYGLELSFYTLSFYFTSIGNALFIFSAYPIFATIFGAIFLKEKISKKLLVGLALLSAALLLIFNPNNLAHGFLGNIFALLNAVCFAIYVIFSRVLSKHGNSSITITFWTVILAIFTSGIGALVFEKPVTHISMSTLTILLIFGALNFLGYNLVNKGFATVKASVGTMLLSLEAIIGAVIGAVFFKEFPSVIFLIGAIEVLLAIYIVSFKLD